MNATLTKTMAAGMAGIIFVPFPLRELAEHLRHDEMPPVVSVPGHVPQAEWDDVQGHTSLSRRQGRECPCGGGHGRQAFAKDARSAALAAQG